MSIIDDLSFDPATSLPRANGELVFNEPWESRAFGMATALADQGVFDWSDFQAGLIAAIGSHEGIAGQPEPYSYYERWLTTLELLLDDRQLVATQDIDQRAVEFRGRPAGHDHTHDHTHDRHV